MSIPPLLTIEDLRKQCRVDGTEDDDALLDMADAAQRYVEEMTSHALTRRAEFLRYDSWTDDVWELVRYPVHAVTSITYTDTAGLVQTLSPSIYWLRPTASKTFELKLRAGQQWPEIADDSIIDIELDVGYPTGACPRNLKRACLMLAAHFYANRETVAFTSQVAEMPLGVTHLIGSFRLKLLA